jgi:uncharacterized protein YegL
MESGIEQVPFEGMEFADNPEPRCACILILDKSGSMAGRPIQELNEGLRQFQQELLSDDLAAKRVEVAIVSFGPLTVDHDFVSPAQFSPPQLHASGDTPMGSAIMRALAMVDERKSLYRKSGVAFYRPWVILMTDGSPTDSVSEASSAVKAGEAAKKFAFFAIGIGPQVDMGKLGQISVRAPVAMNGLSFREFFLWLSSSMKTVSHSSPSAETLALPAPTGWASL